jgi:hypothetical protein
MDKQNSPSKRGGARKGAGKRADLPTPAKRVTVTLDEATLSKARTIGRGNVSAGIRMAVAKF